MVPFIFFSSQYFSSKSLKLFSCVEFEEDVLKNFECPVDTLNLSLCGKRDKFSISIRNPEIPSYFGFFGLEN